MIYTAKQLAKSKFYSLVGTDADRFGSGQQKLALFLDGVVTGAYFTFLVVSRERRGQRAWIVLSCMISTFVFLVVVFGLQTPVVVYEEFR